MAVLENITITTADLEAVCPGIEDLKFDNQENFNKIIESQKQILYGKIKQDYLGDYKVSDQLGSYNVYGTNASVDTILEDVKDFPEEEYLKNRLMNMVIADIFKQNDKYEKMDVYAGAANSFPIKYYIDADLDDVVGVNEDVTARRFPTFHR